MVGKLLKILQKRIILELKIEGFKIRRIAKDYKFESEV